MNLNITETINQTNSFLLDTGADISLIKISKLHENTICFEDKKVKLKGIDKLDQYTETIGYNELKININNKYYMHTFHFVKDDFPIPFDGILGNDFLKQHYVKIDYRKNKLFIEDTYINLFHDVSLNFFKYTGKR